MDDRKIAQTISLSARPERRTGTDRLAAGALLASTEAVARAARRLLARQVLAVDRRVKHVQR